MYCIVGLGNPGQSYYATRHNVGFRLADRLAEEHGTHIRRTEFGALTATIMVGRTEVLIMKPQQYMNRSGEAVAAALSAINIPVDRLVVAYDDADLPLGRVRLRAQGGGGGHRGVESIIDAVGSGDFSRIRLGIGRPDRERELADFVLEEFSAAELAGVELLIERGAGAAQTTVAQGLTAAMQIYNGLPAVDIE
jgi:PTH1 family peptidyl-tRNA hydrolase